MTIVGEPLPGAKLLAPKVFTDARGSFVKTYHAGIFASLGISFSPVEEFFSTSSKGVLRGMHFQFPPHDHAKLVYCIKGRILDVLLDLRKKSPTYGRTASADLSAANRRIFFIPSGIAHGFLSLAEDTVTVYKTTAVHEPSYDGGIKWDSFNFDWGHREPLISERDDAFASFENFVSPFA